MFQIISNNADHFLDQIPSASTPEPKSQNSQNPLICKNVSYLSPSEMKVLNLNDNEHDEKSTPKGSAKVTDDHNVSHLNVTNKLTDDLETIVVTPKRSKRFNKENCDGIVLTQNEEHEFLEPSNLSPILQNNHVSGQADCLHNIQEEEEDGDHADIVDSTIDAFMSKRKRDSFDNISMISTDSIAPVFNSAKKPKLIRTGSITRTLRRSMSFVATKNPISNMIRSRRNSVDPNASISSITSIESTFNESIKKPVKEKFRNFKARIMKGANGHKGEFCLTPKTPKNNRKMNGVVDIGEKCESPDDHVDASFVVDPFKTPLAPPRASVLHSATKSQLNYAADGDIYAGLHSQPHNSSALIDADVVESTKRSIQFGNASPGKDAIQHPDIVQCSTAIRCDGTNANDLQSAIDHQMGVQFIFIIFFLLSFSLDNIFISIASVLSFKGQSDGVLERIRLHRKLGIVRIFVFSNPTTAHIRTTLTLVMFANSS